MADLKYLKSQLTHQKVSETYVEYDGPRIYSFRIANGGMFLAYHLNDDVDHSDWIYVATNQTRLNNLLLQEVSIKSFIEEAESTYFVQTSNDDINNISEVIDPNLIPHDDILLETDIDYMFLILKGPDIDPFSISESEFIKVLRNFRSAITNAMKDLKSQRPNHYSGPIDLALGVPRIGVGSLKMLLPISKRTTLLNDTLAIGLSEEGKDSPVSGITNKQADAIRTRFYEAAPQIRSKSSQYDTVSIGSTFLKGENKSMRSMELTQNHRKKYVKLSKAKKAEEQVVTFDGTIREFDLDAEQFTLRNITTNPFSATEVKCHYDLEEYDLFEGFTSIDALRSSVESCDELITSLARQQLKVCISGNFNSNKSEIEILDL